MGRVCIAVARAGSTTRSQEYDYGNPGREAVQARAVADALARLLDVLEEL